jgi:hypothetical protein
VRRLRLGGESLRVCFLVTAAATAAALALAASSALGAGADTGFAQPYAGTPRYEQYAPTEALTAQQVNQPLGQDRADRLARAFGLDKDKVFTDRQYRLFVSGRGIGGDPASAKLVDESVRIFTNTRGRPLYDGSVLGSYGLFVNADGLLMSLANTAAPTRQVNVVIEPGGYLGKWCRRNGCEDSLRMLYRSAYTSEVVFGFLSQYISGVAQLVPNKKGGREVTVGMSMAPSIWIVNFVLLYVLKPEVAAEMPAWWTPIPEDVVDALEESDDGQVFYADYRSSFRH